MVVFWGGKQVTPLPPRFFRRQGFMDCFVWVFAGSFVESSFVFGCCF